MSPPAAPPATADVVPVVDWTAAAQIAARLAAPGPRATRGELDDLVGGLRTAAGEAVGHVLGVTRLEPVSSTPAGVLGSVHVVDRPRWSRANTEVMSSMTEPVARALAPEVPTTPAARLVGAAEVGALLAALSTRVLGQFDPYAGNPPGRLLLVAPNVLSAERSLDVDARDFRLWVCLHEQTHALQFAAAPWLGEHIQGRVGTLLHDVTERSVGLARAPLRRKIAAFGRTALGVVTGVIRGGDASLLDGVLMPEQRRELAEITAVMALVEGHADVMMDAVGPRVVRSLRTIRARFDRRREGEGSTLTDLLLRRVLGMDAKLAQYRDGAAFVRAVEKQVGRDGLNAVWAAPDSLPTAGEIMDARAWVRRVHG